MTVFNAVVDEELSFEVIPSRLHFGVITLGRDVDVEQLLQIAAKGVVGCVHHGEVDGVVGRVSHKLSP
jgi:hypothetical protein